MTALLAWLVIMWANAVIAGCTYDHKCITNHSASLGLMQTETSALGCKILSVNQYYNQSLMNIANSSWTLYHLSIPAIDIRFNSNQSKCRVKLSFVGGSFLCLTLDFSRTWVFLQGVD